MYIDSYAVILRSRQRRRIRLDKDLRMTVLDSIYCLVTYYYIYHLRSFDFQANPRNTISTGEILMI